MPCPSRFWQTTTLHRISLWPCAQPLTLEAGQTVLHWLLKRQPFHTLRHAMCVRDLGTESMWCLRIVSANTHFVILVGNTDKPTHLSVAAVFQFAEYEQIVTTIVRMRKIDLNFKDPEPQAEQFTADRVVAHILATQNVVWSCAVQQRNVQRLWELWSESAEACLHKRMKHWRDTRRAQTGRGQVRLKPQRRRAPAPSANEGAQNHRTRRLLKLARQVEDLVRQFRRHATRGLSVVPWSMLSLWKKVQKSGDVLLSEARWDVVRLHHFPSLEQVSSLAFNLRNEARQAHEDDREDRMTTWKNWLGTDYRAACNWCKRS